MTSINVKANGSAVTSTLSGKITSGMVGLDVHIEYDDQWSGLNKTAFFRSGDFVRKREAVGVYTTVPWEVLRKHGKTLDIGLEGRDADGNIVMPTVWSTIGTIFQGAQGDVPAAPNPGSGNGENVGGAVIDDSQTSANTTWSSKKISEEIANADPESGGGGGGESSKDVYVVRCAYDRDDNPYIIGEFNWNNMETAYKNGCPVFLQISSSVEIDGSFPSDATVAMYSIYFLSFSEGMAIFRTVDATNTSLITIYNYGRIESTNTSNLDDTLTKNMPANAKAVGDAIGDISTALDHIIELQEELIGV